MAFTHRFRVRFDEVDYARVVYFAEWFRYCHVTLEEFFRQEARCSLREIVETHGAGFPFVQVEAQFKKALQFDDEFEVRMDIDRLGPRSVRFRYELVGPGGPVGTAWLATSCIGRDFKSREIPPPLREAFERHLAADAVRT